jgi:hypothetical protein
MERIRAVLNGIRAEELLIQLKENFYDGLITEKEYWNKTAAIAACASEALENGESSICKRDY